MVEFYQAIWSRLTQDTFITSSVSIYRGQPAVVSGEVLEGLKTPYIHISHRLTTDWSPNGKKGGFAVFDVFVVCSNPESVEKLEKLSERVYDLFHEQEIAVQGHHVISVRCSRHPVLKGFDYIARSVEVEFWFIEL